MLMRTRSAYRAYYQIHVLHLGHLLVCVFLFFSYFLSAFCFLQMNELFRKSDVQKDFQSVRVRNLAPSNSIIALIEAHFDPGKLFYFFP